MTQTMECPHACIRCTTCEDSNAARELRRLRSENASLRAIVSRAQVDPRDHVLARNILATLGGAK